MSILFFIHPQKPIDLVHQEDPVYLTNLEKKWDQVMSGLHRLDTDPVHQENLENLMEQKNNKDRPNVLVFHLEKWRAPTFFH